MVFHPVCWGYNYFTTRGAPSSRVLISYFLFLIGLPERVLVLGHHFFFVDFLDEEVGDSSGHQSRKVHPEELTAGYPKSWTLENVTLFLNSTIFGIDVKCLGCTSGIKWYKEN